MALLRVFPDAGRVEQALLEASIAAPFVDATGYWSFGQLVKACAPATPAPTPLAARLSVARAVRELPAGPFGGFTREAAFARGAVELITHLESQLVTPDQLQDAAAAADSPRAAWLAALWRKVGPLAPPLGAVNVPPFQAVEIHGVHDFSPARLAFIHRLETACRAVGTLLSLHVPRSGNPAVDALVDEVHAELERRHESSQLDLVGETRDGPFTALPLFTERTVPPPAGLAAFSAATPREEAREIARRVRAALDSGAAPEEIAVVFRDLAQDADALLEALEERGVPARARRGVPLGATALGQLALAVPQLADDGYPSEAVARFVSSRFLARVWEGGVEPGPFFAQAGIRDDRLGAVGDRGAFAIRLDALATRFAEGWPKGPVDEVRAVARQVQRLIDATSRIRDDDTFARHLSSWSRALDELGLLDVVPGATSQDQAAVDALLALRRSLAEGPLGDQRLSRREFARWLHDAAADFNLPAKGPRAGAVALLDAREIAGRSFHHVLIGGLADGRFPGRPGTGGLLGEEEKGALNGAAHFPLFRLNVGESGGRLPLRVAEDRLLFHLCLAAATETVTLSHARAEPAGRGLSPSMFLQEVSRAVEGFQVQKLARPIVPLAASVSCESEWRLRALSDGVAPVDAPWAKTALSLAAMENARLSFFSAEGRPAGPYTGDARADDLAEHVAQRFAFDQKAPLTARRLDAWGNCAFAGFLADVIGLDPLEGQGEDIDSRSKGTLLHEVIELLLPVLRDPPANLDDLVRAAVDEVALKHERRAPVGHPLLWKLAKERAVRDIIALARRDDVRPFEGLKPERAEWKFSVAMPGEQPIHLHGKIDRLDVGPGGAGVVDYKSMRIEGVIDRTRRLLTREWQLPVYAWAVRAAGVADPVDAAWVSFKKGSKKLSEVAADAGVTLDELLATDDFTRKRLEREGKPNLGNAVHRLVGRMRAGDFAPRPEDCEHCRFRPVCRISGRKLHDEGFAR